MHCKFLNVWVQLNSLTDTFITVIIYLFYFRLFNILLREMIPWRWFHPKWQHPVFWLWLFCHHCSVSWEDEEDNLERNFAQLMFKVNNNNNNNNDVKYIDVQRSFWGGFKCYGQPLTFRCSIRGEGGGGRWKPLQPFLPRRSVRKLQGLTRNESHVWHLVLRSFLHMQLQIAIQTSSAKRSHASSRNLEKMIMWSCVQCFHHTGD